MTRLDALQKYMKPQFVWEKNNLKNMQTSEEYEGAKDLARMVFVGLADMYGFDQVDVMNYLDMEYESHRNKIQAFRSNFREGLARDKKGTVYLIDDPIKKFYMKVRLCLNAIKFATKENSYVKLEEWISYE
jgi:hypothetical protein